MNFEGKVAVVTGGSRGIGRATALRLAELGADVGFIFRSAEVEANEVRNRIEQLGRRCVAYRGDVSAASAVQDARQAIEGHLGKVDILVNNAGEILRPAAWDELEVTDIRRTIDVNLLSVMLCLQEFAPGMVDRGFGRIVNLTTTYSFNGAAAVLAYTAAKAGVNAVTTAMAAELGSKGVFVNAVAPGNIDTSMTRSAGDDVVKWAIETTPAGRLGSVREVAEAVCFMASHDFLNGHILAVDGGQILKI